MTSVRIGVVILAAGASSRMGQTKQLMAYRGQSLVRHAAETALASVCTDVVVVIGGHAELVRKELDRLSVSIVENDRWQEGMGSSIRAGLQQLATAAAGVVIMLCDQPFTTAGTIDRLVETYLKTGKNIITSEYAQTRGVPAFFSAKFFAELSQLNDQEGARKVITSHRDEVHSVPFPEGAIDLDTPEDYEKLSAELRVSAVSGSPQRR